MARVLKLGLKMVNFATFCQWVQNRFLAYKSLKAEAEQVLSVTYPRVSEDWLQEYMSISVVE